MSKFLVTGASGFIGSKLVSFLDSIQVDVRLLARRPIIGFETLIYDCLKDSIPASAVDSIDTVFHLAGYAHDLRGNRNLDHIYYKVNVDMTIELARLAALNGVKKFIFVSSVKAGGEQVSAKCADENDQYTPDSVYGKSKREAELELLAIGQNSSMKVTIVRPSLVYGPGVKGNLSAMMIGVKMGWFPPLPEVNNRRSMIHVDDVAGALWFVAQTKNTDGEIFIVTDGQTYSSREIYNSLRFTLNKSIKQWSLPRVLFDGLSRLPFVGYRIDKLFGDNYYSSKKIESLGFKPTKILSDINETSF